MVTDKDLKDQGKSSFAEYEGKIMDKKGKIKESVGSVRVIRWNDNSICTLISTMGSGYPVAKVLRWDKEEEKYIEVECPGMVKYYNAHMGGVDKLDALIAFYRIFLRSRKWYHRLFFHFIDVCVVNSWLKYRRDYAACIGDDKYLSLYDFKMSISHCLRKQRKPLKRAVGRPRVGEPKEKRGLHKKRKVPTQPIIQDQVGHFPISLTKRGKCRRDNCKSYPMTYCLK